MCFFLDQNDEIAGRAAPFTRIALAGYAQLHTLLHAGRNIDTDHFFPIHPALAFTYRTFCGDGGSFAVTGRAGGNGLHLAQKSIAYPSYLSAATAGAAGLHARLILGAAAVTGSAGYML